VKPSDRQHRHHFESLGEPDVSVPVAIQVGKLRDLGLVDKDSCFREWVSLAAAYFSCDLHIDFEVTFDVAESPPPFSRLAFDAAYSSP
jgi:hypothetical protein